MNKPGEKDSQMAACHSPGVLELSVLQTWRCYDILNSRLLLFHATS